MANSKFGSFIKLDKTSKNRECFDIARVLISVSYLNEINTIIYVGINGHTFKIKVSEEIILDLEYCLNPVVDDRASYTSSSSKASKLSNSMKAMIQDVEEVDSEDESVTAFIHGESEKFSG